MNNLKYPYINICWVNKNGIDIFIKNSMVKLWYIFLKETNRDITVS